MISMPLKIEENPKRQGSIQCKVIPIRNIDNKTCADCKHFERLYKKHGAFHEIGAGTCNKVSENKKTGVLIKAEVKRSSKKACYYFE